MTSVTVRPATALDLSALWSWRKLSVAAAILGRQDDAISFERFTSLFQAAKADSEGLLLIAVWKTLRIGAIRFTHAGGGVYRPFLTLHQPFFARGFSQDMLVAGLSYLQRARRVVAVEVAVPAINPAMTSLFREFGFSVSPLGNGLACVFRPEADS